MRENSWVNLMQGLSKKMIVKLNAMSRWKPVRSTIVSLLAVILSGCASSSVTDAPAANTATSPTNSTSGFVASEVYYISPEDVLSISVWREDELQRELTVRPDGGITFPLIGDVQAVGLTTDQLREVIRTKISAYVPEAVVSVAVVSASGLKVFVTGKVNRPGQFLVGRYVDVLQAITLAGGLTPFANSKNIRILRRTDQGDKIFNFNYAQVERGEELSQNIVLRAGDTVIVP